MVNMAVKDSIGGWKDNAFIFKIPNACTFMQKNLGSEFPVYLEKLGVKTTDKCPIPAVNIVMYNIHIYSVI